MLGGLVSSYRGLVIIGNSVQDLLLLASRLYWGHIFFTSGAAKFDEMGKTIKYFASLGIPFAEYNAYIAAGIEYGGGICLMLGLASRLVSIPLAITMIVALATAHIGGALLAFTEPSKFLEQPPITFLMVTIMIFCFGPGRVSLDNFFARFFEKKNGRK